mgnify:CR=1 FL=1
MIIALLPGLCALAGCHSNHIETTIENRTGAPVRLLEVDYPSASFGTDSLAAGASYHYRFKVLDSGPIKLQYTGPDEHQFQITGPQLDEHQDGRIEIVLLPGGKAEFHPQLTSHP